MLTPAPDLHKTQQPFKRLFICLKDISGHAQRRAWPAVTSLVSELSLVPRSTNPAQSIPPLPLHCLSTEPRSIKHRRLGQRRHACVNQRRIDQRNNNKKRCQSNLAKENLGNFLFPNCKNFDLKKNPINVFNPKEMPTTAKGWSCSTAKHNHVQTDKWVTVWLTW